MALGLNKQTSMVALQTRHIYPNNKEKRAVVIAIGQHNAKAAKLFNTAYKPTKTAKATIMQRLTPDALSSLNGLTKSGEKLYPRLFKQGESIIIVIVIVLSKKK